MVRLRRLGKGALCFLLLTGCSGTPPKLGVIDGKLTPCDSRSHCVSSQSTDPGSRIEPLRYTDTLEQAKARLKQAIAEFPRTAFTAETTDYWRVEFKSFFFRFVDDVEFLFAQPGQIEVRSGSRVGDTDFGVNRGRIGKIQTSFNSRQSGSGR